MRCVYACCFDLFHAEESNGTRQVTRANFDRCVTNRGRMIAERLRRYVTQKGVSVQRLSNRGTYVLIAVMIASSAGRVDTDQETFLKFTVAAHGGKKSGSHAQRQRVIIRCAFYFALWYYTHNRDAAGEESRFAWEYRVSTRSSD